MCPADEKSHQNFVAFIPPVVCGTIAPYSIISVCPLSRSKTLYQIAKCPLIFRSKILFFAYEIDFGKSMQRHNILKALSHKLAG